MSKRKLFIIFMALVLIALVVTNVALPAKSAFAADGKNPLTDTSNPIVTENGLNYYQNQKMTQAEREAAAERFKAARASSTKPKSPAQLDPGGIPHYFGPYANYANSPMPMGSVTAITADAGGTGYTAPSVAITDAYGTGSGAVATATVAGGVITGFLISNGGTGYTAPVVTITDAAGTGAIASATIGGVLTGGIRKFVDSLAGVGAGGINNLGQYIPAATADTATYSGSAYYEIALVEYEEKMHTDLPPTRLRGYVQLETSLVSGAHFALTYPNGTPILNASLAQVYAMDKPHYLGPLIIAQSNVPVRIKFTNYLPKGSGGNLFLPVDTTLPGAGPGPIPGESYKQNRATVHLHGNDTVWISDGTPRQWITPADENTPYPQGVTVHNVPDMPDPGEGSQTFFYTNAQSARLMFYHDHAEGITRLNVYAGEAAGYLITDQVDQDMINGTNVSGVNPTFAHVLPDIGIPLIVQDKTWVDPNTIAYQDPTWNWGTTPPTPHAGNLWLPHVYMPNQNPWDPTGTNAFGRWFYGPWFWPPTNNITYPPIANPYFGTQPWEPPMMPATPNPSSFAEAFMDTPLVNGTVYPYLTVEPKTYRFRILNAANDRFFNLQLYQAYDPVTQTVGTGTEVKIVPASATAGFPAYWPTDGRTGGVPDPATVGPSFVQIGTEGGFLPTPVVLPNKPVNWNYDVTNFDMGDVNQGTLIVGSAERADVLVDFRDFAGKTLILYNDAPAAFPASDARYEYYTGKPDQVDTGGTPTTQPGYGPNIRTIMQIRVAATPVAPAYNVAVLNSVFAKTAAKRGVFEVSQPEIIVPNSNYNSAYNATFTAPINTYSRIADSSKTFTTIAGNPVTLAFQPKALHDEMGGTFDIDYGRMNTSLGLEVPSATTVTQIFMPMPYNGPPLELIKGSVYGTPIGSLGDGTQIWTLTHNGVDTHPIHFHLYDVQLINRVAWDNIIREPDPNELGWKETVRINPLQTTTVALRPTIPTPAQVPFPVPNSVRLIDTATGAGDALRPPSPALAFFDPTGVSIGQILNHVVNFGWEYVWHCHILAHEEMDMMHSQVFAVPPQVPSNLGYVLNPSPLQVTLTWRDNSLGETGFTIQRAENAGFTLNPVTFTVGTNVTSYVDNTITAGPTYYYHVMANNMVGDTQVYAAPSVGYEHFSADSAYSTAIATNQASPPPPPTLVSPANASLIATLTPALDWSNSTGATSYGVQVSTDPSFVLTVINQTGLVSSNFNVAGGTLSWNTTYYWRANATNGDGTTAWSPTWSFQPVPPTPGTPTLTSPANGAIAPSLTPWLMWAPGGGGAPASYRVQISTNVGFSAIVLDQTGIGMPGFMVPLGIVQCNSTYYWRVAATNANGTSAFSAARTFLSPIPTVPELATPANAATVTTLTPRLQWYMSTCASSFALQVSTDPGFGTTVVNQTGLTSLFYDVPGATLNWGNTYYWRLNATNPNGTSAWSTARSFQIPPAVAPTVPVLSLPASASTTNLTPRLEWLTSTGATTYGLQVSIDSGFGTTVVNQVGLTGLLYDVPAATLNWGVTYYWRVNATNIFGTSAWSTVWNFQTVPTLTPQKIIGANGVDIPNASNTPNYFVLSQFTANSSANMTQFKINCSGAGNVKVAIYADNAGQPGNLLNAVNASTPVVTGWNTITFPSTALTSGTNYWLAFNSDSIIVSAKAGVGNRRFGAATYSTFTFPGSAGALATDTTFYDLTAGWGSPAPATPIVANLGATNVSATAATINGNLTSDGGSSTAVTVYWGAVDGGTNTASWANNVSLGVTVVGPFSTNINGLTNGTTYYFRSSATNAAGTSWAPSSASFVAGATAGPIQRIGASAADTPNAGNTPNYFILSQFSATSTGNMTEFRVNCTGAGNIKVAIYSDISGQPGSLLNAVNASTPVVTGWNTVSFPSTALTSGTNYWLAFNSGSPIVGAKAGAGNRRYAAATYSTFTFPASAGALATDTTYYDLEAGWGPPSVLTPPTVTDVTGATNITGTSATLSGNLVDGGAPTSVIIYWGPINGGTTPAGWANSINLGVIPSGAFSANVNNLITGTTYYYRSLATNSMGSTWDPSSISFVPVITPGGSAPLIGASAADASNANNVANYFILSQFTASSTGSMTQFKINCAAPGNVKVGIYSDNAGQPGSLLNAVNTSTAVIAGWNTITFPSTALTSGTNYWLAFNSDSVIVGAKAAAGNRRYVAATFSTFTFPASAGALATATGYYDLTAGWGGPPGPSAPTITNAGGASNITATSVTLNGNLILDGGSSNTVRIYWGTVDGGTTPVNWANMVNLGNVPVGPFFTNISGLTTGTTYYYRSFATNSTGSAWASSSASFVPAIPPPAQLIGASAADTANANNVANYFILSQFAATGTGNMTQFKINCASAGNVKVALYSDNAGQPAFLLNAVNTSTPVVAGWNTISFPTTALTSGTNYWLAFNSDSVIVGAKAGVGNRRYVAANFTTFAFPASVGALSTATGYYDLEAGWGN